MKRLLVFLAGAVILLVFGATFIFSFWEYSSQMHKSVLRNVATFMVNAAEGRNFVNLPDPDYSLIALKTKDGQRFISSNMNLPFDSTFYSSVRVSVGESEATIYYKKPTPTDYVMFLASKPVYAGMLLASVFLFISLMLYVAAETKPTPAKSKLAVDERFMDKLKALRLTLATMKIIPEESAKEMRKVIDSILKESK